MKSGIDASKRVMGYVEISHIPARNCGECNHAKSVGDDVRCAKGGFFVRVVSGCKKFEQRKLIAIGPTDV